MLTVGLFLPILLSFVLVDSRDICRYVCTEFPRWCTRDLYGTGALERASIEKWMQAEAQSFDAPSAALAFHLAFPLRPVRVLSAVTISARRAR